MKKTLSVLMALALGASMAFADDAPVAKVTGFFDGGIQYFNNLGKGVDVTAADSALNGFNVPYFALTGVNVTGKTFGYNIDIASSQGGVSQGFGLWDAYVWANVGSGFTFEAGALSEMGFTNWNDWDSYLSRGKFGSLGAAIKYSGNGFNAIFEVPAYNPSYGLFAYDGNWAAGKTANNSSTNYKSSNGQPAGLDGSANSAAHALYVAANYTVPNVAGILAGYHGNGTELGTGKSYGADVWFDLDLSPLVKNSTILFEINDYNYGYDKAAAAYAGDPGDNIYTFFLVGYNFGTFTVKSNFEYLIEGTKQNTDNYDFRIQPAFIYPVNANVSFVLTARIDDLAGKADNGEGTGSAVYWVNPEVQFTFGSTGIQLGAFYGDDYTGSWFFGNQSSPVSGTDAKSFLNAYVTWSFGF